MRAYRSQKLTGFTLFAHPGKGWQMSIRRENEHGWDVQIIPEQQAAAILSMLETSGHPDGPWGVRADQGQEFVDQRAALHRVGTFEAELGAATAARGRLTRELNK